MSEPNHYIIKRSFESEKLMAGAARSGRSKALAVISQYTILTTEDGRQIRENNFDQPPTVGELVRRIGPDAWIVSVAMRRGRCKALQTKRPKPIGLEGFTKF